MIAAVRITATRTVPTILALFASLYIFAADTAEAASGDPFEYQNQLFRELFGENAELYTPLEYQARDKKDK